MKFPTKFKNRTIFNSYKYTNRNYSESGMHNFDEKSTIL